MGFTLHWELPEGSGSTKIGMACEKVLEAKRSDPRYIRAPRWLQLPWITLLFPIISLKWVGLGLGSCWGWLELKEPRWKADFFLYDYCCLFNCWSFLRVSGMCLTWDISGAQRSRTSCKEPFFKTPTIRTSVVLLTLRSGPDLSPKLTVSCFTGPLASRLLHLRSILQNHLTACLSFLNTACVKYSSHRNPQWLPGAC